RRPADSRHLRNAASRDRGGALPGSRAGRGAVDGRRRPHGHRGAEGLLSRHAAAAVHGRQDPVPDPESPAVQAPLPADRAHARAVGAGDRLIVPDYAAQWKALIPGARVVTIEGAGHMLPWEQPEAFVDAVVTFLA